MAQYPPAPVAGQPGQPPFIFGYAPQAGGYLPCFSHKERLDAVSKQGPSTLRQGQRLNCPSGNFFITMQPDGAVAMYNSANKKVWSSKTEGKGDPPFSLVMQVDGNLVLYDGKGRATWSSKSNGKSTPGANRAVMQDDRNFVVYDQFDKAIWATGTN